MIAVNCNCMVMSLIMCSLLLIQIFYLPNKYVGHTMGHLAICYNRIQNVITIALYCNCITYVEIND